MVKKRPTVEIPFFVEILVPGGGMIKRQCKISFKQGSKKYRFQSDDVDQEVRFPNTLHIQVPITLALSDPR